MSAAEFQPPASANPPELFLNREQSLLAFNWRVLEQAKDAATPLLERLKFLCIASTNLDEFFEIRVARLQQQVFSGSVQAGADSRTPQDVLRLINDEARRLVGEQYRVLNEVLLPELEKEKIRLGAQTLRE